MEKNKDKNYICGIKEVRYVCVGGGAGKTQHQNSSITTCLYAP